MSAKPLEISRNIPWKPSSEPTQSPQEYNTDDFTGSPSDCVDSVYRHLKALQIYAATTKGIIDGKRASSFPWQFTEIISNGLNIAQQHYQYCIGKKQEHEKIISALVEQKRETRSSLEAQWSIKQELQNSYTAALIGQNHNEVKAIEERIRESVQQREVLETRLNAIDETEKHHQLEMKLWVTVTRSIKRSIAIKQANNMKAQYLAALETFKPHFIAIAATSSLDDSLNLKAWAKKELDNALASIGSDVNKKSTEILASFEQELNQST